MNVKQLAGIALVSTIVVSCTACSTITRIAYHKTAYEFYNPSLHNDTITITGSKPEELVIKANISLEYCSNYKDLRVYDDFKVEDYGTTYKVKLPIISDDINDKSPDNCNNILFVTLRGHFKYNNEVIPASGRFPLLMINGNDKLNPSLKVDNLSFSCVESNPFKSPVRTCENKEYTNQIPLINLQNKKEINVNFEKGKYWDKYFNLAIKKYNRNNNKKEILQ